MDMDETFGSSSTGFHQRVADGTNGLCQGAGSAAGYSCCQLAVVSDVMGTCRLRFSSLPTFVGP